MNKKIIISLMILHQVSLCSENTVLKWGMSSCANGSIQGNEICTEDTFKYTKVLGGHLFLLCDGHGDPLGEYGLRVCDVLRDNFHVEFEKTYGTPQERLVHAFQAIEQKVITYTPGKQKSSAGSTAVAVYINNGIAHVAHVGDSRVICFSNDNKICFATQDHNFKQEDEVTRIKKVYGNDIAKWKSKKIAQDGTLERVNGLPMSRVIGNQEAKKVSKEHPYGDGAITATPKYAQFPVTFKRLVIATDGLWDVCSNDNAAEIANHCMNNSHKIDKEKAETEHPKQRKTIDQHALKRMQKALDNVNRMQNNAKEFEISLQDLKKTPWNVVAQKHNLDINRIKECFFNSEPKMNEESFNAAYPLNAIPMVNDVVIEEQSDSVQPYNECLFTARYLKDEAITRKSEDNTMVCFIKVEGLNKTLLNSFMYWLNFMPRWQKQCTYIMIPLTALATVFIGIKGFS